MTVETTFAVSGQHYLFNVQTFAHTVLALGGGRGDLAPGVWGNPAGGGRGPAPPPHRVGATKDQ